jgi:hypothetical protein
VGVKLGLPHNGRNKTDGVIENRALKNIFGPGLDELVGDWRRIA